MTTTTKKDRGVCARVRERENEKAAVVWWDLDYWMAPEKDKMWSESQVFWRLRELNLLMDV